MNNQSNLRTPSTFIVKARTLRPPFRLSVRAQARQLRRSLRCLFVTFVILGAALAGTASAWSQNPPRGVSEIPVIEDAGSENQPKVVPDYEGGFYVAWIDVVAGRTNDTGTLKLIRLNADGNPAWTAPVTVGDKDTCFRPRLVPVRGGLFVVWRTLDPRESGRFWVQRVDSAGNARWAVSGVRVLNVSSLYKAISDGAAGIYVLGRGMAPGNPPIKVWHFDSVGNVTVAFTEIAESRTAPIVDIAPTNRPRELFFAMAGTSVKLRKIAAKGGWGPNTIASTYGVKGEVGVVPDERGGAIIVFGDRRRDPNNEDLFAQHVDEIGRIQWKENGIELRQGVSRTSAEISVVSDGAGGALAVATTNDPDASSRHVYAYRITRRGAVTGVRLDNSPGISRVPEIAMDGGGGAFVVMKTEGSGLTGCLVAQWLDAEDNRVWGENGVRFGRCSSFPPGHSIAVGPDRVIVVWSDNRNGYTDIFRWIARVKGAKPWTPSTVPAPRP